MAKFVSFFCYNKLSWPLHVCFISFFFSRRMRSVNDDKVHPPLLKKKSGQNLLKFKEVKIWNYLPTNIKTLFFVKFKKSCRQYVKNIIE